MTDRPASRPSTDTILPHALPKALDRANPAVQVLSLDCFDTLLWRDTHAPADVFADLPGITIGQRISGEANARKAMRALKRRNEVSLEDIYAHVLPNADEATRRAAIEAEIAAEARACFAFAPTVALMMEAKARGLEVIIVSDTYLSAKQLRGLIKAAAGPDVVALIDRVFASSEFGISKSEGLLAKAIKTRLRRAHEVLHIGDNLKADYKSARALGIPALHLAQFSEGAKQRLRFERSCAQLDPRELGSPEARIVGLQPHRALLAQGEPQMERGAQRLGYSVLGPVFVAYDAWLRQEAERLREEHGGTVHWLFMLRDGHLPALVHAAGDTAPSASQVEISRFVATAASLTSREAYQRHMALEHGLNPSTLARQFLMSEEEIASIVGSPESDAQKAEASERLLKELRRGQRQKITARRAREMADGLVAHIRAAVDPKPGDTLMLVDLGYNGSAQNAINALLAEELGVHVAGRYLLCRERSATGLDKTGLIDARHFDPGLLEAMCSTVAVIEQLATCEMGSVIGYEKDGTPIRKANSVKGAQSAVRDTVQAGAVRFARDARNHPVIRLEDAHSTRAWREAAAQVLTRFMFLPFAEELDTLKRFEHDVNLGSERMVALFDAQDASDQMKRRGLFYMKGSSRMFLPADLAQEDMNTRLSLLVQQRFALGFTYTDYAKRGLTLPSFHLGREEQAAFPIEARPTHDGYYVARLPLSRKGVGLGLQMGALCEWVEVADIQRSAIASLKGAQEDEASFVCNSVRYDGMRERAPGIFECESESALLLILPEPQWEDTRHPQMIEVVFRPIKHRGSCSSWKANGPINAPITAEKAVA